MPAQPNKALTFFDLVAAMRMRLSVRYFDGSIGLVNGITAEDGSGRSWIVHIAWTRAGGTPTNDRIFWHEERHGHFFTLA